MFQLETRYILNLKDYTVTSITKGENSPLYQPVQWSECRVQSVGVQNSLPLLHIMSDWAETCKLWWCKWRLVQTPVLACNFIIAHISLVSHVHFEQPYRNSVIQFIYQLKCYSVNNLHREHSCVGALLKSINLGILLIKAYCQFM